MRQPLWMPATATGPNAAHPDPVDVMTDLVDGFTVYVHEAEYVATKGRRYRNTLLWVHTVAALIMAPAFASLNLKIEAQGAFGTQWELLRQIPGSPGSIAVLLFTGALILGIGCVLCCPQPKLVGLALLGSFYLICGSAFSAAIVLWYTGELSEMAKPPNYPPVLYLHMAIVMVVHMGTLARQTLADVDDTT